MRISFLLLIIFVGCGKPDNSPKTITKALLIPKVGMVIDSLNGIYVYYNGSVAHTDGRNLAKDGYNLGLKYQCVEFVKRYYYYHYHHKMPDTYGDALTFFDTRVKDGEINKQRNLRQFTNGSKLKPQPGDLVVFGPTQWNPYGHVAIISAVYSSEVEIIQQNPGPMASSRILFSMTRSAGKWRIENQKLLGWLRKK